MPIKPTSPQPQPAIRNEPSNSPPSESSNPKVKKHSVKSYFSSAKNLAFSPFKWIFNVSKSFIDRRINRLITNIIAVLARKNSEKQALKTQSLDDPQAIQRSNDPKAPALVFAPSAIGDILSRSVDPDNPEYQNPWDTDDDAIAPAGSRDHSSPVDSEGFSTVDLEAGTREDGE